MTSPIANQIQAPLFIQAGARMQKAATVAAGFGAASPQALQQIDAAMQSVLAEASVEMMQDEVMRRAHNGKDGPGLRKPDMAAARRAAANIPNAGASMTDEAMLMMLLGHVSDVVNRMNAADGQKYIDLVKEQLAQHSATGEKLSAELAAAKSGLEGAASEAEGALDALKDAQAAVAKAQAEVDRLAKALAGAEGPEKEALQAQLDAATRKLETATAVKSTAEQALVASAEKLNAARVGYDQALQQAGSSQRRAAATPESAGSRVTNDALITELLAMLQNLINDANNAKLANETKLIQESLKAREAENMRRSQEYQEQLEKAERAQKKMGCIGKIIGWVLTVVAVVAAPFTGGVSMALAGIGLALAIADECGAGIMDKIMEPIAKAIMKVISVIADAVASTLKAFGVEDAVISKIKDVIAVIVVAIAVIAAVLVGRSAGAQAAMKLVTGAMGKLVPKILASAVKSGVSAMDDVARSISSKAAKAIGTDSGTMATRVGKTMLASQVLTFGHHTAQGIGGAVIADMYVVAQKLMAEIELGLRDSKIFQELLQRILESMMNTQELVKALFGDMAAVQESEGETAAFISGRVARV